MAIGVDKCLTDVQAAIDGNAAFRLYPIVVDAERQPRRALTGNPCVTVGQREDTVKTYGLTDGGSDEPVDVDIGTPLRVEEIEPPVVGGHPHIIAIIGMEGVDAVARQHVAQPRHTAEGGEAIAIVIAESTPRAEPHQSVTGLSDAGNDVSGQSITQRERTHIAIRLGKYIIDATKLQK